MITQKVFFFSYYPVILEISVTISLQTNPILVSHNVHQPDYTTTVHWRLPKSLNNNRQTSCIWSEMSETNVRNHLGPPEIQLAGTPVVVPCEVMPFYINIYQPLTPSLILADHLPPSLFTRHIAPLAHNTLLRFNHPLCHPDCVYWVICSSLQRN